MLTTIRNVETPYDMEEYTETYNGTPADFEAEHNYDISTGEVKGATWHPESEEVV